MDCATEELSIVMVSSGSVFTDKIVFSLATAINFGGSYATVDRFSRLSKILHWVSSLGCIPYPPIAPVIEIQRHYNAC